MPEGETFTPFTPTEDLFVDLEDGRRVLVARAGTQVTPARLRAAGIGYADLEAAGASAEPGDEPQSGDREAHAERPRTTKKSQPES